MCKEYGGLGIPDLRELNICLLASWLKIYNSDREKLQKELIEFKYDTEKPNVLLSKTTNSSSFFKVLCGLLKVLEWVIGGRLVMGEKAMGRHLDRFFQFGYTVLAIVQNY